MEIGANAPLAGIRVLELGELLAGPMVGTLLGEFGAEVIKIERPEKGDVLRQFGPMVEGFGLFWQVNARNKKSVVLDFRTQGAREVLADLLAESDVLVNSMRPGTLEQWGFDDDTLGERFPGLVRVYASAFGRGGVHSGRGGYDPIAQGFSGLSYLTGESDGPPMRAGGAIPVCDFTTGYAGALGAMMALYRRDRGKGGSGGVVDIALYDVAFRMLGPLLSHYDLTGKIWARDGNHSLGGAPTGHFLTRDDHWICTSIQNDELFAGLARLVGRPEWIADARFATLSLRTQHRDEIEAHVSHWIRARTRDEVLASFTARGLPAGPINSMADLAVDPHLASRGTISRSLAERRYREPARVPHLVGEPEPAHAPAPGLGEDTERVLRETLRYTPERIRALLEGGIVAAAPVAGGG